MRPTTETAIPFPLSAAIRDETGKFYDSTYESLVELCAYFCTEFKLKPEDVIRHYDVTGKICPKYFVDHEDAWDQFHKDVEQAMKKK